MLTTTAGLVAAFAVCAALSLGASSALIVRIERLGTRFGVTEAVLGLTAAIAADAPEITSAVTALARGQHDVGVGVALGANVFQLAALLGIGAVVARGISLDRRVVTFEAVAAVWIAVIAFAVVVRGLPGPVALLLALLVFVPYVVVSAMSPEARARLPLPIDLRLDVEEAIEEEEEEIAEVIGPVRSSRSDEWVALLALVVVISASVALEGVATTLGTQWGIPDVVLGGVVLAVVTSLPNLVAAIYLARRGRGAATLSEAMNSNRVNTLAGLLVPSEIIGAGFGASAAAGTTTLATWYVVMTVGTLALAYLGRGLGRLAGLVILAAYGLVVLSLVG